MSTLQTLLLRRSTIESTQKMMSAMRVVAATHLRKLQNMFAHVAQQEKDLSNLLRSSTIDQDTAPLPFYASGALKTHSKKSAAQCLDSHMLSLKDGTLKKPIIWVVLGADKGLCGSFHTQILRIMRSFQPLFMQKNSSLFVWGQKTSKLIERQGFNITHAKPIGRMSALERVKHTLDTIEDSPTKPQLGFVWLQFKTALSQTPRIATLSYLLDTLFSEEKKITLSEQRFLVEPNAQNFLKYFFPFYTKKRMLLLFLEASLSEEGTRMAAMDSASRNSDDILKDITLLYNRTRQAMITKELIEVVSGANAL